MFEILYRITLIFANLKESPWGYFVKSPAYENLDPSEKSAVSYFLALSVTKWAAGRLGIPWLLHLDVYANQLQPYIAGRSRPDLVGMDASGRWHVFEAKGRSGSINGTLVQRAKTQTEQLKTICGSAPNLRVASIAHFSGQYLSVRLVDPRVSKPDAVDCDLPGGETAFLTNYYRPFVDLLDRRNVDLRGSEIQVDSRGITVMELTDVGVTVGLDRLVHKLFNQDNMSRGLRESLSRLGDRSDDIDSRMYTSSFMGPDGIFIGLGQEWSSEAMKLDPVELRD